jgi:hypothetical protein
MKEFGVKKSLLISLGTIIIALLIGGITARMLPLFGIPV